MRTTVMEVDINKFKENIKMIKEYVGNKKIMPVIKANAYGTHINKILDVINEFDIVAVAFVSEAVELRKLGYEKEVFVLNQPDINEIEEIIKYDIIIGLSSVEFLEGLKNIKSTMKVHLEIETGMNRTGIKVEELYDYIDKINDTKNIKVEGVYTHLSSADYDSEYTNGQLVKFKNAVSIVKERVGYIKYIHSSASNGLLNYDDNISNMVRPGMLMYGFETFLEQKEKLNTKPICVLKTKVSFIKGIVKGESISYSRKFISNKSMKIATIPIGYADGLRRELFKNGEVVINNRKAKIVGTICMDSCMIDVTDIANVSVGTDVYIWDNNIIVVDELAKKCNTINYEIISSIQNRVPRIFIE